jgi:hypothetical protein
LETLFDVVYDIIGHPVVGQVSGDTTRGRAGHGASDHTHRPTDQANQTARDGPKNGAVSGINVADVFHLDITVLCLGHHRDVFEMESLIGLQLLQVLHNLAGFFLITFKSSYD